MILVVVCHPDDEALWFGGSLHAISKVSLSEVCVICLSGRDSDSPREDEFYAAKSVAGYAKGVVLGFPLREAQQDLPNIPKILEQGLLDLGYGKSDIELLITHSPYGDEHRHPHHVQAFRELLKWTKNSNVPMAFFSTIPLPIGSIRSELRNYRRNDNLHLNIFGRCSYGPLDFLKTYLMYGEGWTPKFYVQWQINSIVKRAMLNCYQSINLDQHETGYAMFTSSVESLYIFDDAGVDVIKNLIVNMSVPGANELFDLPFRLRVFASKLYRKMKNALYS